MPTSARRTLAQEHDGWPARRVGARDGAASVIQAIRRLERGLRIVARRVEQATGLSAAQLFVLEHLADAPVTSLGELAAHTFTDRSSVSIVVDRLEKAGLAARSPGELDRRRWTVRITPRGRAMLRRAPHSPTELVIEAVAAMPPATVRRLSLALRALNDRLGFHPAALLFEDR